MLTEEAVCVSYTGNFFSQQGLQSSNQTGAMHKSCQFTYIHYIMHKMNDNQNISKVSGSQEP